MDRNLTIILGSAFILVSGLVFSLERLVAYIHWFALTNTGTYPTEAGTTLADHIVSVIFLLIGAVFLATTINKNNWHDTL